MKHVLVLSDTHYPYVDRRTMEAVENLMGDYKWDEVVHLGDFLDLDCISAHNKENLRAVETKRLFYEYNEGQEVLDHWKELAPKAKFTLIEGNHEHRVQRYIDASPQLEGMIEVPVGLDLAKKKINWVPFWSTGQTYDIGKATFLHGGKTTNFHTKTMAYNYGRNIFYGHTHDVQSYSVETAGHNSTYVAQSVGCLCKYDQPYMRGRPSKWQQAVTVIDFYDDGFFTANVLRIFNHKFIFNRKLYTP